MSNDLDAGAQWERVSAELRACREAQRRAWGDVDNLTLGRYLAGEASAGERCAVEAALADLPQLRELTDLVRDVLQACPSSLPPPEPVPEPAPVLLPSRPSAAKPAQPGRWRAVLAAVRRRASVVAAACLLVVLGVAMPPPESSLGVSLGGVAGVGADGVAVRGLPGLEEGALPPVGLSPAPAPGLRLEERDVKSGPLAADQVTLSAPAPAPPGPERQPRGLGMGRGPWAPMRQAAPPRRIHTTPTSPPAEAAQSLFAIGVRFAERGDLTQAEPALCQAHAIRARTLGPAHAD